MVPLLKKWLQGKPRPSANEGWPEVARWAEGKGWTFRGVRESEGFVIDGRCGTMPWRVEFGPSQRSYVSGFEWRFRADLPVPRELQALILNRPLMMAMERTVFDQYIEGVQTQIDTDIPPEMRWLVMFPKLGSTELRTLREHFAGVTNYKPWVLRWLNDSMCDTLLTEVSAKADVFVMMVARARLTVRTPMLSPDVPQLEAWVRFSENTLREAHRASMQDAREAGMVSTQPSLWAAAPAADSLPFEPQDASAH